jgi:hypothetical protein
MSFEAYKVAVKLVLVNQVSTGLIAITAEMRGLHGATGTATQGFAALERQMLSIKRMGMAGGIMAGLGFGMIGMLKGPLDEAIKFDQAVGKFKLFGMGDAVNAEAVKFAKGMDSIGTSYTENMKLITEAQGVFRESGLGGSQALEGAKLAAPMLAKIQFATEGLDDESKSKMHTQSLAMLRFVEMRGGLKDAGSFNRIADEGWKAIQSSGGNINWEQMRQFMARGGVAAQGLTDQTLFGKMEPIIGELKGSTAGNALMTAYNRLVGGVKVPNQVAHILADNGIWDAQRIEWNSQGGIKQFRGNPLKDMDTFSKDPTAFYEKTIMPMYAGMNNGAGLSAVERARENTIIFGRTGGMMFSLIDRQMETLKKSALSQAQALGVDRSVDTAAQTPAGQRIILRKEFKNLENELGNAILPMAIKAMNGMISALHTFNDFAKENPVVIKTLMIAFTGLAVSLAFGGVVMLAAAGFRGLSLALSVLGASEGTIAVASRGVSMLGKGLGVLGAIGAAFEIGWQIGGIISRTLVEGTKFGDWLGGLIAKILGWMGNKEAQDAVNANKSAYERSKDQVQADTERYGLNGAIRAAAARQSMVAPAGGQAVHVTTNFNIDGRKVGEAASMYQAKQMGRPPAGPSYFDSSMHLSPVAFNGNVS